MQELLSLLSLSLSDFKIFFIETKQGKRILGQQETAVFLIKKNTDPNSYLLICLNPCVLVKKIIKKSMKVFLLWFVLEVSYKCKKYLGYIVQQNHLVVKCPKGTARKTVVSESVCHALQLVKTEQTLV